MLIDAHAKVEGIALAKKLPLSNEKYVNYGKGNNQFMSGEFLQCVQRMQKCCSSEPLQSNFSCL